MAPFFLRSVLLLALAACQATPAAQPSPVAQETSWPRPWRHVPAKPVTHDPSPEKLRDLQQRLDAIRGLLDPR